MKKIAFFIPDLTGAGAERVVSNLSIELSKEGYQVYLILYTKDIAYDYKGELIILDKQHIGFGVVGKVIRFIKRTLALKRAKKEHRFEAVISFLENPDFQNIITRTSENIYISVRNFPSKSYEPKKKFLAKLLYKKADKVIAVSEEIGEDLVENFNVEKGKIKVIYNPYDIKKIETLSQEEMEERFEDLFRRKVIITVGRHKYQKGQWHLIRAFSKVCESVQTSELVLIGEGPLRKELEALAMRLEISHRVHFLGFQSNPYKFMKRSAVFAFTSLYEGFPNALTEAMVCGVPIISSDCRSGPKEILRAWNDNLGTTEEYGILIGEFSGDMNFESVSLTKEEEEFGDKLIELLEDEEQLQEYSRRSLSRVKDFEAPKIVKQWMEIL